MSPYAEVLIELLLTAAGGRSTPVHLGEDGPGHYRPHFRVGDSGEWLGVEFVDGPGLVAPGQRTYATVRFLYESTVDYSPLAVGARFTIVEGPRVVGHGTVTRRE